MTRKVSFLAAVAASVVLVGASAQADTLSSPGWINGTGNPQDNFTVTTNNGIELGLRAKYRHNPATIAPSGTTYTVVPGLETNETSGGNGTSTRGAWNYEYSINLNPTNQASGYDTLADIFANLTVTDPNGNVSAPIDILNLPYTGDNTGFGPGGQHDPALLTDWLAQNSENPSFGNFPFIYNANTTGLYTFKLDVGLKGGSVLASDSIQVNVAAAPLPSAAFAGLGLLGGLGVFGLKRRPRQTV